MDQEGLDSIVNRLRHQGRDDAHTEVKASASSLSRDVWDSVSAFANTQGGTIILGLDEAASSRCKASRFTEYSTNSWTALARAMPPVVA